jgi:hypothetical protein
MTQTPSPSGSRSDAENGPADSAPPASEKLPLPPGAPLGQVAEAEPIVVPPPPSFGRQMAQLVIIPAAIVALAVGVALLFGKIAGASDTLDNQLLKLKQSSGAGKMAFNLQDPRYKDRSLAAYNVATMIPGIKSPTEKRRVSDALIEILAQNVGEHEDTLQAYLLMAIGELGQPGGFEAITERLGAADSRTREGAIAGVLAWPDKPYARAAVPRLTDLLADPSPMVRAKAAAGLGELAPRGDARIIAALHEAMSANGIEAREAVWNSAIALGRLGDEQGAQFVARLLLDRDYLAKQPESGEGERQPMSPATQDRVILSVLAAARTMASPLVWEKVERLADNDPNRVVRSAAHELLRDHQEKLGAAAKKTEPRPVREP